MSPIKKVLRERIHWKDDQLQLLIQLGEKIIQIKKEKNISSKMICEKLEMDKSNYRRIERGQSNVSILLLLRKSEALSIPLEELLKF